MDIKTDSRIPFFADLSVPVFHLAGENTRFRPPGRELLLHLGKQQFAQRGVMIYGILVLLTAAESASSLFPSTIDVLI